MVKLRDEVTAAERGGGCSSRLGGPRTQPSPGRCSPDQNNHKAHRRGEKGPACLSHMTDDLRPREGGMAWGPWGARKQREAAGSSRALRTVTARPGVTVGAPCSGLWGLICTPWASVSPPVSTEGIRDPMFQAAWGLPRLWVSAGPRSPAWNPTQLEGVSHRARSSPWRGGEASGRPKAMQSHDRPQLQPPPTMSPQHTQPLSLDKQGRCSPLGPRGERGTWVPPGRAMGILAWPALPRGDFFSWTHGPGTQETLPHPALLRELGVGGGGGVFPVGSGLLLGQAEGSAGCARGQSWPLTQP